MIKFLIFSLIALFSITSITDAFSLENEIGLTVKTDKSIYDIGEPIVISGSVLPYPEFLGIDVVLQIWKNGSIIDTVKIYPDKDGKFSYVLNTDSEKWTQSTYVVRASYGERPISDANFKLVRFEEIETQNQIDDVLTTKISIDLNKSTFFLDEDQQTMLALVKIQNHGPENGKYFMKITHLPSKIILKESQINLQKSFNNVWVTSVYYPILESDLIFENELLLGEFEIQVSSEFISKNAVKDFSILKSSKTGNSVGEESLLYNPKIKEITPVREGILISWFQNGTQASSFDILIDGKDTGQEFRTSESSQIVDRGQCFSVQARYPQKNLILNSEEICPQLLPAQHYDRFGILHIYPTGGRVFESHWDQGGERILHFDDRDPIDTELTVRGSNPELVINGKGEASLQAEDKDLMANSRIYVYDENREKTWKNTEITVYMMRVSEKVTIPYSGIVLNTRTEHQDATLDPSKGLGYTGRVTFDGRSQFVKEVIHGKIYENSDERTYPWNTLDGHMPYFKWTGVKFVTYDLPNGNVKLELFMDLSDGENGGTWIKTNEFIDDGSWNSGVIDEPATSVYIKADGLGLAAYKNFSVREIIPPS